jgi:acetylcholinesterase
MLAYGGTTNDLFHAAFMMSGAPIPVGDMTGGQEYYDFRVLVQETGCNSCAQSLNNCTQTLACLRQVPIDILRIAVDKTPSFESYQVRIYRIDFHCDLNIGTRSKSLRLAWEPRADGNFLLDNLRSLYSKEKSHPSLSYQVCRYGHLSVSGSDFAP